MAMKRAAAALFLAGFALLAYGLHRFDSGTLLDQADKAAVPELMPNSAGFMTAHQPVTSEPELPAPGDPITVTCMAGGPFAGAGGLTLRWRADGGPERETAMRRTDAGFTAALPAGTASRRWDLLCFDPSRRPSWAWRSAVHVSAPEHAARLPRFRRAQLPAPATTSPADAEVSYGGRALLSDRGGPLTRFDRRTEAPGLAVYWRSDEADEAGAADEAGRLALAAEDLRAFMRYSGPYARTRVYMKRCRGCLLDGGESVSRATREEIRVVADAGDALATAVHELTHYYTPGLRGCTDAPALCEGMAVMASASYTRALGAVQAEAAKLRSRAPPGGLLQLDRQSFYAEPAIHDYYRLSGSLVLFLVERHGARPVLAVIAGRSYEDAFGRSRAELEGEWRASLAGL